MRFEKKYDDPQIATQWFMIDLMQTGGDNYAVIASYGFKDPLGEDALVSRARAIFTGPYTEAMQVMLAKMRNREQLGYVAIEQKQEE